MSYIQNMRFSGGQILRENGLTSGELTVDNGRILDRSQLCAPWHVELEGYMILPGIIDLHGDAFERHLAPRPSAPFPSEVGLQSVDREAAANGVTTAWMAQSWSWEGGSRGPDFAVAFMEDLAAYQPQALTDLRIQLRCETHTVETQERLLETVRKHKIDYVIFNDHIGEAMEMITSDPEGLAIWGKRAGRDLAGHIALIKATKQKAAQVPRYLCSLSAAFDALGVTYGSHDDANAATREYYGMIGARICEFPTHHAPAQVARANDDPILMGAPNVVRGGSQSGNIAATDLVKLGLCDVLVSDYHYPSLARAAHRLADMGLMPFSEAWQMISTTPARVMGLDDRGEIANGKRADLVICNRQTRQIEGTIANGRWSHICGDLAGRIMANQPNRAVAAE
ncbi:alpha-D-ribose 1-methylphosphonate 5-triphosphate diphosphatase [Sulfitobacter donghicola]|uniref:Alkylphosphonate utilization protein n=1 Tax=Sulfitobacter donghicola DSW-25 = KCTC 12864 = JCM 14565 TaxID=1300350 RepID=A0A073IDR5_9RHOB|nr:alpha-D-ribose 1-methylphosphonate 5-triphosphate diphosphatase [Sulfitobacter donghicola]KEJ87889.1 alkylphosphonate utilization protein [Sulfitobacter donghicola DSW-25 = KCTC 12864 = JCM 14565]